MKLRYDGPGHVLRAFGKTVLRGEEVEFTESEARSLLAQRQLKFTVDPVAVLAAEEAAARPSAHGSRRQWAGYAESKGVPVTDLMTRDEIIAAVDDHNNKTEAEEDDES